MHRGIYEFTDVRKINDILDLGIYLALAQPQHGAVDVNVFASGQYGIETCAQCNERAHPPAHLNPAMVRFDQAVEHFEQRGLARTVPANHAQAFA